jgi:hypothetical protein
MKEVTQQGVDDGTWNNSGGSATSCFLQAQYGVAVAHSRFPGRVYCGDHCSTNRSSELAMNL